MKSLSGSITRSAVIAFSYVNVSMVCRSAPRLERRAQFLGEYRRLLPRREVAALFRLVVIDQVGVRPLGPTPRRYELLSGKGADGRWELHAFHVEIPALVFPIETGGRDPGVRQPEQRDGVEDLVTSQFASGAGCPAHTRHERSRWLAAAVTVVHQIRGQGDRRVREAVQRLGPARHHLIDEEMLVREDEGFIGASFLG